ncbi:hypothetical protein P692DRAFT_20872578 [Suillus brevipes Sb2]|nr:hypothetical protein P692DRAFT_20872578 [Suillus brevipes Sb2]
MGSDRAKLCDLCDQTIKPRGWSTHRKACEKNTQKRAQDQRIADSIRQQKGLVSGTAVNAAGYSLNPLETQARPFSIDEFP